MNTLQLKNALENIGSNDYDRKVFAIDELKQLSKPRALYICNTAPRRNLGEHWFAIFKQNDNVEIFCSFGTNPKKLGISDKLLRGKKVFYNPYIVQGLCSSICGPYSLFFLLLRVKDISFKSIMKLFSRDNLRQNDVYILSFLNKYFPGGYIKPGFTKNDWKILLSQERECVMKLLF